MNWFLFSTLAFTVVSVVMILVILVQRPSGGGLAGAFGGAGGGTDSVFGGRIGDALTWGTVAAFVLYLVLAIGLNLIPTGATASATPPPTVGGDDVPAATETDGSSDTGTPVDPGAVQPFQPSTDNGG